MNLVKARQIVYDAAHTRSFTCDEDFYDALKLCAHSAGFQLHLRRDKASLANALLPGETKD